MKHFFVLIVFLFAISFRAIGQTIITFTGTGTLTQAMVNDTLKKYKPTSNFVAEIIGYTEIGANAFAGSNTINTNYLVRVISTSVTTTGNNAFYGCSELASVDFSAVTTIKNGAFSFCSALSNVDFPLLTTIENNAFRNCISLGSINFPLVTTIGNNAFINLGKLSSVTFGTGFTQEINIKFSANVFLQTKTENIDLILGQYVLPERIDNIWQDDKGNGTGITYTWKSITIVPVGIGDDPTTNLQLYPNPTSNIATIRMDLEKAGDLRITLTNITGKEVMQLHNSFVDAGTFTHTFSVADLPLGTYFIRLQLGDSTKYEKLIVK